MHSGVRAEPGFARREPKRGRFDEKRRRRGPWGNHGFPHDRAVGNARYATNKAWMAPLASNGVLLDTASSLQNFVNVFVGIYILLIFVWVLLSWIRVPYSRTTAAVQEFLDDVIRPYLRLFRWLPRFGPFDLSPIVGVVVLLVAAGIVNALIGALL
jgi:uncharacterized protein YggT (Ycf19 family)